MLGGGRGYADPVEITPTPTAEEVAAIVAAHEALWPKPGVVAPADSSANLAWRFSGRWWQRDRLAHVDRPWR